MQPETVLFPWHHHAPVYFTVFSLFWYTLIPHTYTCYLTHAQLQHVRRRLFLSHSANVEFPTYGQSMCCSRGLWPCDDGRSLNVLTNMSALDLTLMFESDSNGNSWYLSVSQRPGIVMIFLQNSTYLRWLQILVPSHGISTNAGETPLGNTQETFCMSIDMQIGYEWVLISLTNKMTQIQIYKSISGCDHS